MKHIRAFARSDIPQVADLHRRVFGIGKNIHQPISSTLLQSYFSYFETIFFNNPWYDDKFPSLVYQDAAGNIIGFLGVMRRCMLFNRRPINVAISSQLIVESSKRSTGAGVWLSKAFLSGPQDLSLTDEANNISRKLWEGLGGETALLFSVQWKRLLRPGQHSIFTAKKAGLLPYLSWMLKPAGSLIDKIASRKLPHYFGLLPPQVSADDLTIEMLLTCLSKFSDSRLLWPEYDYMSLKWVLSLLTKEKRLGVLRKYLVRGPKQEILGWYLYHLNPGGVSTVVQMAAKAGSFGKVLDHLFYDAWQQGSLAVSGQIDPKLMPEFSERRCFFDCGQPWVLAHSKNQSLVEAIRNGNAFLSKLEGELCMRFQQY